MTEKTGKEPHKETAEKPKHPATQKTVAANAKPEEKDTAKKAEEPAHTRRKATQHGKNGAGLSALVALLALLLSLALGGAAWYFWQQLQGVQQSLQNSARDRQEAQLKLDQKLSQISEQQTRLNQQVEQLRAAQERVTRLPSNNNWLDIEALIQLAVDRVQLNRDVDGAIAALQWADQRLARLGEPGLASLRRQVANDIKALQAVNLPDYVQLDQRVLKIAASTRTLPFRTAAPQNLLSEEGKKPAAGADTTQERGWNRLLADALKELKPLVTIRRKHEVTPPMLTAEETALINQILQLRLERVRIQLAMKKQPEFNRAVDETLHWLQQHYKVEDEAYKATVKSLQDLRAVELQPALPDINGSLRELRAYRALLQGKSS